MHYSEQEPSHFHARYGEHEALIAIETLDYVDRRSLSELDGERTRIGPSAGQGGEPVPRRRSPVDRLLHEEPLGGFAGNVLPLQAARVGRMDGSSSSRQRTG